MAHIPPTFTSSTAATNKLAARRVTAAQTGVDGPKGFACGLSAQPAGSDVGVHAVCLQEECGRAPEPRNIAFMGPLEPGWFAGQG